MWKCQIVDGVLGDWQQVVMNSDLNWQYATWTRSATAGAGTYVSTYYSPYMIFVRICFNSDMAKLNSRAWYDGSSHFYPFAQYAGNLWGLKPGTTPTAESTQYLGHVICVKADTALGEPKATTYGAIWTWWDGQVTHIGHL
jgi:hypothetical protein